MVSRNRPAVGRDERAPPALDAVTPSPSDSRAPPTRRSGRGSPAVLAVTLIRHTPNASSYVPGIHASRTPQRTHGKAQLEGVEVVGLRVRDLEEEVAIAVRTRSFATTAGSANLAVTVVPRFVRLATGIRTPSAYRAQHRHGRARDRRSPAWLPLRQGLEAPHARDPQLDLLVHEAEGRRLGARRRPLHPARRVRRPGRPTVPFGTSSATDALSKSDADGA